MSSATEAWPRSVRVECPAGAFSLTIIPDASPTTRLRWRRGLEILAEMAAEAREQRLAAEAAEKEHAPE